MKKIIATIIVFLLATVCLFALFGCTVAGTKHDEGKITEKAAVDTKAALSGMDSLKAPGQQSFLNGVKIEKDGSLVVLFPPPSQPVEQKQEINKDLNGKVDAKVTSKRNSGETSGFYWILLGIGIFILACAAALLVVVWIVLRVWQKSQGVGMITFLKDQLVGLSPGTEAAKVVDTVKAWVRSKYNLR